MEMIIYYKNTTEDLLENPISICSMSNGDSYQANFTVNVSSTKNPDHYLIDFNVTSSYGNFNVPNNDTLNSYICIGCTGGETPPTDSCTYDTGDWLIDCTDSCVISDVVEMDISSRLSISGSGTLDIKADISGFSQVDISDACWVTCSGGSCIVQ